MRLILTASLFFALALPGMAQRTKINLSRDVAGTLPVANGGTGQTSQQAAIDALLPAQSGHTGEFLKTNGTTASWAAVGTVTSVGMSVPSEFSVSGSPVTTSGTLAVSKATQSANTVWAGPNTGSPAAPTFRALVAADLPSLPVTKAITVESPTASEDITLFFTDDAITVTQLNAVIAGTGTPSVTWTIRFASDRSAAGTEVVTSGTATTSISTGSEVTSFSDATIPAGSWVWLKTTAMTTATQLNVTIEYTRD